MAKNESSENYLEAILMLSKKLPVVRSVDIANELGFKKSSVSIAMKKLRQENHITVTDAGFIYLTDSGKEIANMIYERHEFISKWLIELGVPEEIATDDACQIFRPCAVTTFLRSTADKRFGLQPTLAVQEAHAFRPMELVRRYRKSINTQVFNVQRSMGIRLHCIGMEGHIMLVG